MRERFIPAVEVSHLNGAKPCRGRPFQTLRDTGPRQDGCGSRPFPLPKPKGSDFVSKKGHNVRGAFSICRQSVFQGDYPGSFEPGRATGVLEVMRRRIAVTTIDSDDI
jgi:hypothetical protein